MNRERAEAYLRLLAEEELRRAVAWCAAGPAGSWPVDDAVRPASVAGALAGRVARRDGWMASGRGWSADRAVAGLYLAHYRALVRMAGMLVRVARVAEEVVQGSFVAMHGGWPQLGSATTAEAYPRQEVMNRSRTVLRYGAGPGHGPQQLRPGGSSEHLARVARVAQIMTAVNCRVAQHVSSHRPVMPPEAGPGRPLIDAWLPASRLEQFTATDDRGVRYQMTVLPMAGGPDGWTLLLHPRSAHDPQWLDLSTGPGQPGVRLDLTPSAPAQQDATVTVTAAPASPGEHLLHVIAAGLLATLLAGPAGTGPDPAGPEPGPLATAAHGLGQVTAALQDVGALSPLSPLPGQLAALCAVLDASGHDITAPPTRDLPAPWLSMLAQHHRRKPRTARDGCAAMAVTLPELDGISLAILGLHNCQGRTIMHLHASGPKCPASCFPEELPAWPLTWIRDSSGSWHATRTLGRGGVGEAPLRMELVPPLSRTANWIETITTGQSAQIRTRLPLRWE